MSHDTLELHDKYTYNGKDFGFAAYRSNCIVVRCPMCESENWRPHILMTLWVVNHSIEEFARQKRPCRNCRADINYLFLQSKFVQDKYQAKALMEARRETSI
jgi:hypothetical protein